MLAPRQPVNDPSRVRRKMFATKYQRGWVPNYVVRLHFVAAVFFSDQKQTQITINAGPTIEQRAHEIYRRRKLAVANRTVDGQWPGALFKPRREHECWKIGTMVDVEMCEQDYFDLGHVRAALSKSKSVATAGIY